VIFKGVGEARPYPPHEMSSRDWASLAPRSVRLADLVTTKRALDLETLLSDDATIFGDLFCHVVRWHDVLYLEDGLHRAVRAALQQRSVVHARVLDLDALRPRDRASAS
jgi:Arc/MetJ family transcription regulator